MSVSIFKYLSQPHVYLDNLRNIATILGSVLIPVAISASSRARERKRATLEIVRAFTTDKVITDRQYKLYCYRLYAEGDPDTLNPYPVRSELVTDSILMINLCDTVALEAKAGLIERTMLYDALGPTMIGVHEVVMARLIDHFGMNLSGSYEDFKQLVERIRHHQKRHDLRFATKIPAVATASSISSSSTATAPPTP